MKKLLGILVLGLLWCNVGFAEEINLVCTKKPGNVELVYLIIIDDEKKTLTIDGEKPEEIIDYNNKFILFFRDALDKELGHAKILDRVSGIYENSYKCIQKSRIEF